MKYSKWIALLVNLSLAGVCFMHWTYHKDVNMYFTGFESARNAAGKPVYGQPGNFIIFCVAISVLMIFIPKVWAKFTHLFFAGLILAYAIRCYHLFTSSYRGFTPEKQAGIYLLMLFSVLAFVVAIFPELKIKPVTQQQSKGE